MSDRLGNVSSMPVAPGRSNARDVEALRDFLISRYAGKRADAPALEAEFIVSVNGEELIIRQEVVYRKGDPVKGEVVEPLYIVPAGRAKDQVKIYEAQQVAAVKEEARLKELVKKGGASQSQVDAAEAEPDFYVPRLLVWPDAFAAGHAMVGAR